MMRRFIITLTAVILCACGASERDQQVARNRALNGIEAACMQKAEIGVERSCTATIPNCRNESLAHEATICSCAKDRIESEFLDNELAAIADMDAAEAEMAATSTDDFQSLERLRVQHNTILDRLTTPEQRQRVSAASAEAGRLCRLQNP